MTSTDFSYEQFVVIAETEWKFGYGLIPYTQNRNPTARITKHSLRMERVEWNIAFNDQTKKLEFTCQTVADGAIKELHMELVGYYRPARDRRASYKKMAFKRHIFTPSANLMSCKLINRDSVFTIRILKDRPMFPDFTLESTVGRNNGKLRVGDQVFHVHKQFLSMHSEYFDLLYNGNFKEATDLFMLAGEFGFNKLQKSLMNNASFEEAKRMLAVAAEKAFALK